MKYTLSNSFLVVFGHFMKNTSYLKFFLGIVIVRYKCFVCLVCNIKGIFFGSKFSLICLSVATIHAHESISLHLNKLRKRQKKIHSCTYFLAWCYGLILMIFYLDYVLHDIITSISALRQYI